jgi:hypothetical protein
MKTTKNAVAISNVHVDNYSPGTGRCSVGWNDSTGSQYHFWTNVDNCGREYTAQRDEVLYKNPPTGTKSDDPVYHHARKLTMTGSRNAQMLAAAMEAVNNGAMFQQMILDEEQRRKEQKTEARDAKREYRIKEAGPELLAALQRLMTATEKVPRADRVDTVIGKARREASVLIAKVQS